MEISDMGRGLGGGGGGCEGWGGGGLCEKYQLTALPKYPLCYLVLPIRKPNKLLMTRTRGHEVNVLSR